MTTKVPNVFDIQKFSVHDGPGIRTIIFLKGCPMSCLWCANPESQSSETEVMAHPDKCIGCGKCAEVCGTPFDLRMPGSRSAVDCDGCGKCAEVCYSGARTLTGKKMTAEEVIREADKDMIFYRQSGGGITFSGGEAMLYPDFIAEICEHYKNENISTAVETCGDVPWENFEKVIPYLDLLLFDVKIMDPRKHEKYTGRPNERILDNLRKASEQIETIVRMPIVPTVNDDRENIEATGRFLKSLDGRVKKMHILPYHNYGLSKYHGLGRNYMLEEIKAPDQKKMEEIRSLLQSYGIEVTIGG